MAAFHGMNRLDAHKLARNLGCEIWAPTKSGEFRYSHPKMLKPVTGNNRTKGVGRHVTSWLMELEKKVR